MIGPDPTLNCEIMLLIEGFKVKTHKLEKEKININPMESLHFFKIIIMTEVWLIKISLNSIRQIEKN
jgi:hypothetical protein